MKRKKKQFNWQSLGRVLVCTDAANLENSVKDLGWWVDYKKLYNFFKRQTRLGKVRHYCVRFGNERHDKFLTVLKKAGIKLITKPLKVIKEEDIERGDIRKANFDVEIAIDAIRLISSFDTLILFSGDSDFEFLAKELRTRKKIVWIISSRGHISRELARAANKYIPLSILKRYFVRRKKSPPRNRGEVDDSDLHRSENKIS